MLENLHSIFRANTRPTYSAASDEAAAPSSVVARRSRPGRRACCHACHGYNGFMAARRQEDGLRLTLGKRYEVENASHRNAY